MKGDHIMKKVKNILLSVIVLTTICASQAWAVHSDLDGQVATFGTSATPGRPGTANVWYLLKNNASGYYLYETGTNGSACTLSATAPTSGSNASDIAGYLFRPSGTTSGTILSGNEYNIYSTKDYSYVYGNTTSTTWNFNNTGTISYSYKSGKNTYTNYLRYNTGSETTPRVTTTNSNNTWQWIPVTLAPAGPSHTLTFQFFYDANNNGSCDSGEEKGAAQTKSATEGATLTSVQPPTMPAAAQLTSPRFGIGTPTWANCIEDHSGTVTADATFHISIPDDMTRVAWNRVASQTSDIANWYNLRGEARKTVGSTNKGWYAYNDGGTVHFEETAETDVQTDCWGLVGNPYDGFLIVNADAGLSNPLTLNLLNGTQTKYNLYIPSWTGTAGTDFFISANEGFCMSSDGTNFLNHEGPSTNTIGTWTERDGGCTWWTEVANPVFEGDISVKVIYNYWYDEDEDGEVDEGEIKYTQNTKTYPGMDMPTPDYSHFGIKYTVPAACSGVVPSGGKTVTIPLEDDMSVVKWTRTASQKSDVQYWFNMHMNATVSGGGAATQGYYVYNKDNTNNDIYYNATASEANTYMWALVGNPYKFKVLNYAEAWGYSLKSNATSGDDGTHGATVSSGDYYFEAFTPSYTAGAGYIPASQGFCLQPEGTSWFLNLRSTTVMGSWTGHDEGSTMWVDHYVTFKEVGVDDYVIQNAATSKWASYNGETTALSQIADYPDPDRSVWHLTRPDGVTTYFYYRTYGNIPVALEDLTHDELESADLSTWKMLSTISSYSTTAKNWYTRNDPNYGVLYNISSNDGFSGSTCWTNNGGTAVAGNGGYTAEGSRWRMITVDDYYQQALDYLNNLIGGLTPSDEPFCVKRSKHAELVALIWTDEEYATKTSPEKVERANEMLQQSLTLADYNELPTGRYLIRNYWKIYQNDDETFLASLGEPMGVCEEGISYWNVWDATNSGETTTGNGIWQYTLQNEGNRYVFTPGQDFTSTMTTDNGYIYGTDYQVGNTSQDLRMYPAQYFYPNITGPYCVIATPAKITSANEYDRMWMWAYSDHVIYGGETQEGFEYTQSIWQFIPLNRSTITDEYGTHDGEDAMIQRVINDLGGHVGGVITLDNVGSTDCLQDIVNLADGAATAIANGASTYTFTPNETSLAGYTAQTFSTENGPLGPQVYKKALQMVAGIKSGSTSNFQALDDQHPYFLENMGASRPEFGARLTAVGTGWEADYAANVTGNEGSFWVTVSGTTYKMRNGDDVYIDNNTGTSGQTTAAGSALSFQIQPVIPCVWRIYNPNGSGTNKYLTIGHDAGATNYPLRHYNKEEIFTYWKFMTFNEITAPTMKSPAQDGTYYSTYSYPLNYRIKHDVAGNPTIKAYYCTEAYKNTTSHSLRLHFKEVPVQTVGGDKYYYMEGGQGYLLIGTGPTGSATRDFPTGEEVQTVGSGLPSSAKVHDKNLLVANLKYYKLTDSDYLKMYGLGYYSSQTTVGYYNGEEVKATGLGFYPISTAGHINGNSAYIRTKSFVDGDTTISSSVREANMPAEIWIENEDGTVTAIMEIAEDGTLNDVTEERTQSRYNGNTYDLTGRLVTNPTRGLYITNGKKVLYK